MALSLIMNIDRDIDKVEVQSLNKFIKKLDSLINVMERLVWLLDFKINEREKEMDSCVDYINVC